MVHLIDRTKEVIVHLDPIPGVFAARGPLGVKMDLDLLDSSWLAFKARIFGMDASGKGGFFIIITFGRPLMEGSVDR